MIWRQATNAIMHVSRTLMGEYVQLTREGLSLAVEPTTLMAIFESATNFDETGVIGYADIDNFKAMVDFKRSDLLEAPQRGDLLYVPASNQSFLVMQTVDDGWARYRCLLEDV